MEFGRWRVLNIMARRVVVVWCADIIRTGIAREPTLPLLLGVGGDGDLVVLLAIRSHLHAPDIHQLPKKACGENLALMRSDKQLRYDIPGQLSNFAEAKAWCRIDRCGSIDRRADAS